MTKEQLPELKSNNWADIKPFIVEAKKRESFLKMKNFLEALDLEGLYVQPYCDCDTYDQCFHSYDVGESIPSNHSTIDKHYQQIDRIIDKFEELEKERKVTK